MLHCASTTLLGIVATAAAVAVVVAGADKLPCRL